MFQVKINIEPFLAILSKMTENALAAEKNLPYESAVAYRDALHGAIVGQKFPVTPKSLSPKYEAFKRRIGHSQPDYWNLYGDVRASIDVWQQSEKEWVSGIPDGSTKRSVMYAGANEETRPLFGPVLDEMSSKAWNDLCEKSFHEITGVWC